MLTKRIIACLDVRDGRVVKGVGFRNHQDLGDVEELARRYVDQGADELVFYDIAASADETQLDRSWIRRLATFVDIPFTVAGGINSLKAAEEVFHAGADKISINSPALARPQLIDELCREFGSQSIVVGIDSQLNDGTWWVWEKTGRVTTMRAHGRSTLEWVAEVQSRGAGELVLNCMAKDGHKSGFDIEQLQVVRKLSRVPLIASGGAGRVEDFRAVFDFAHVDGALAAGVFHRSELTVGDVKDYLSREGIAVRPQYQKGKKLWN